MIKTKALAGEPRLRKRPWKIIATESMSLTNNDRRVVPAPEITSIKDQIKTAMLINKYSSKIHKPILYDKATNEPIHRRRW